MNEQFEIHLMECLDALEERGPGASLDDILARYPEDAPALRGALRAAAALSALDMQPEPAAQAGSRQAFLAAGMALKRAKGRRPGGVGFFLLRVGAFLGVALAAGAIPVAASGNALPGDALYPVKREVESVRLQMAPDEAARRAVADEINAERIQEVDDLVKDGRSARTEFEGRLDGLTADALTISGRVIRIPAGAQLSGWAVGDWLEVMVEVKDGQLVLVSAAPISGGESSTPAPAMTPAATHQPEPEQSHTAEPTHHSGTEDAQSPEPTHEAETGGGSGEQTTSEPSSGGGDGGQVEQSGGGDGSVTPEPGGGGDHNDGGGAEDGGGKGGHDGGGGGGGSDKGGD